VFEISFKVLGQENIQKYNVTYEFPKNWWQHLKMQLFPKWLEQMFPVKYKPIIKTFEFDHRALVPKWDQFPKGQEVVMYSTSTSPHVSKQ
jgi:hypothetical protein